MAEQIFKAPGFFEREIDLTNVSQNPTGIPGGLIGVSEKGPAFVPVTVGTFSDFETVFGGFDINKPAPYAANVYLRNRFALTFTRVLGAGSNATTSDFDTTRTKGTVVNAGFQLSASVLADGRHADAVQFLTARHKVTQNETYGMPIFSNNSSYFTTGAIDEVNLVRGVIFTATGTRIMLMATNESYSTGMDDYVTPSSDGKFKLVISTSAGSTFGSFDGLPGLRIFSASLNPTDTDYIGKLLNTDPSKFGDEKHLLYLDFAVDAEVASLSTGSNAVCITSGSTNTSSTSGDSTLPFLQAFGKYNTRYTTAKTPSFISQPFGLTEYDLFYFEPISDGASANEAIKISIANLKASTDPKNPYGTFTVLVRKFDDDDLNIQILEQFNNCNLNPESDNYVGKMIGNRKVYFNFDVENEEDRRLVRQGKYPLKSKYVRIIMNSSIEDKAVPSTALPFGFRGVHTLNTNPTFTDAAASAGLVRLGASGSTGTTDDRLKGALVPPLPYRFKVTRGAITASAGLIGNPGPTEVTDTRYYWGVKFSRNNNDVLNVNVNSDYNKVISAYTKFVGIEKLDTLVTGSGADIVNNNKFTLARVALGNSALSDLTSSAAQHMKAAAYVRDGAVNASDYTLNDGVGNRITMASILQADTATNFNRFSDFAKFTTIFYGGFDGLNLLDKEASNMTDKASSTDSSSAGSNVSFTSPGLATNQNGYGRTSNIINSYRTAIKLMTDRFVSNVNTLAIPGQREPLVTDYALDSVKDYGLAEYIMDVPYYDSDSVRIYDGDKTRFVSVLETADEFESRAVDNEFGAAYFPNVVIEDVQNNRRVTVPASVAAMGAFAYNDSVSYPWYAPAGFNRASLDFVKMSQVKVKQPERERLYTTRINPIVKFPGEQNYVVFSQQTLEQAGTALQSLNVQRMIITIKQQISDAGNKIIWEQLTPDLYERWKNIVKTILSNVQINNGIERYDVICDERNNTQLDVENNRMNCSIKVVPVRVAEFIAIDFIITNSGIQFV